ncbi:hypothetical protein EXT42_18655 [Pseudoalteromonas sp. CO302Y]|uniref:hypothetical protein n=1 Tax=unclassified Pseudoalteromonas TaxID=194690 RepID=UPI001022DDF8|nr:hypothetical protein EXT42_18655 [Pseudoalteromonas sp. CO302Y]RZG06264.1 hypothetical protein EXT40_18660 [Pseudoalteromonas sp. CO133X]
MMEVLGLVIGVIGTAIAIYQAAIINESKKRKNELQYLFAGINAAATQKQQAWQNQISLMPKPNTQEELKLAQLCVRARDDAAEIANLTSALEGTIDPDNSAIVNMMDKYKLIVEKTKRNAPPTEFDQAPSNTNKQNQPDAEQRAAV